MNRLKMSLMVAVLVAASGAIGLLANSLLKPTLAQSGQQWEYCALSRTAYAGGHNTPGNYWISYFNDSGVKVDTVQENATERSGMAKAIAKLGTQGWELVGAAKLDVRTGEPIDALYFKRPKQQ
jgi:hypothetical protein